MPDPGQRDRLEIDPEIRFSCSACARCCTSAWQILMPEEKKLELEARPWAEIGRDPSGLFVQAPGGLWAFRRDPGATHCVLLGEDRLCDLHRHWGAESKPGMCQRFPMLSVQSAERVWVSANYGCKAIQEGHGPPLGEQGDELAATFASELDATRPDADIGYPVAPGRVLGSEELAERVEALVASLGDGFFGALSTLACFAAQREEVPAVPPRRPESPAQASAPLRYAFALSLYSDVIDASSLWDRVKGVWTLPRLLGFRHRYTSRLTGLSVDMASVFHHPGHLDAASHRTLLGWLRARLRGRSPLKDTPHFAAGVTRLLLHADAVLYFARAAAEGRDIEHADVLLGLTAVELFIANQQVLTTLARIDPRLPRFWQDPAVALGAPALFAPVQPT